MANIINAFDMTVELDGIVVGCLTSGKLTLNREMVEASCSATGPWKTQTPGQKSWEASLDSLYREFTPAELTTNKGYGQIFDMLDQGARVKISFATQTGSRFEGNAYVSQLDLTRPEKDNVTWSASFAGDGELVQVP